MKTKPIGKIFLSMILVVSLVLTTAVSAFAAGANGTSLQSSEEQESNIYSSTLSDFATMKADGWEASYSADPQAGVAFEKLASLASTFEIWGSACITRGSSPGIKWSNDWDGNPFSKMSAATYTAKKYKYFTLDIEYKFESESRPWPVVTFNQPSTIPEMFYASIKGSQVTNPKSGDSAIGAYVQYQGHLNVSGKGVSAGKSVADADVLTGTTWHKLRITVTPGGIYSAVYKDDGITPAVEVNSVLPSNYQGGYIALMLNGWSIFKNISITELDFDYDDYSSTLGNLTEMEGDGWEAAYSSDPQAGVAFEKLGSLASTFEKWTGITRGSSPGIKWSNDWNGNPFSKMSAATYTAKKYKYFTLDIEYKFESESRPWPVVTFNQPSTIPEMFYASIKGSQVTNPKSGDSAIGAYVQYQGHLNVSGKNVSAGKSVADADVLTGTTWHKLRITVTPGGIYSAVYKDDGITPAVEVNSALPSNYQGGYIALMLNGWSEFRNIKITEYPEIAINNYYATPDGNGGYVTDSILIERTYGQKVFYSDIAPERAGYSFMGFYKDAEYKNTIDLNTKFDKTLSLYAKWSDFADVTANGTVDIIDLVRMKKISSELAETTKAADLDFDGFAAKSSDLTVLRRLLFGQSVATESASAAELMNNGILYPLGRTMVLDNAVEMDYVNTGFVLKGSFEGDVKADFTTNRVGSLLNVSVDGGENEVIEMSLDDLTVLAEGLAKGEHTIEVISGTSMRYSTDGKTEAGHEADNGTLRLEKIYYGGTPLKYVSDKSSRILFLGDSITCGMGLDTDYLNGYKASNAYYSYASVLGRMLNAEVETVARCGSKTCHFAWATANRGKGPIDGVDWLTSINLVNKTEYDYANNQPDVVVINLGSNDIPYSETDGIKDDTGDKYKEDVTTLLNRVHKMYPNAEIIWTVGMVDRKTELSKSYIGYFKNYVETWGSENNTSAYFLDLSDIADLSGYNGHPTKATHQAAAEELYNLMRENNIGVNWSDLSNLASVQKKK